MTESNLARALSEGRFAITAELVPPASSEAGDLMARAAPLKGIVDAVNVTDNPRARAHMSSLAASAILVREGIEPVMQIVCRDRNRLAMAADLLGAAALGIRNFLALSGDPPDVGDEPEAKGVFDIDSTGLMRLAAGMRDEGKLPSGREIKGRPNFFVGTADIPVPAPDEEHIARLQGRVEAGAGFVQTQLCYDVEVVRGYAEGLKRAGVTDRLGILIGVGPLASAKSARWMRDNLFGTIVPDAIIERMEGAADAKAEGVAICAELIDAFAEIPGIAGAHLMSPVDASLIPAAVKAAKIRR